MAEVERVQMRHSAAYFMPPMLIFYIRSRRLQRHAFLFSYAAERVSQITLRRAPLVLYAE